MNASHLLAILTGTLCLTAQAAGQANVSTQNKCDKPVAYKIETKGSALNTSLPQRTSKSHKLNHGDKIVVGGQTLHTVSASSAGKTVLICGK